MKIKLSETALKQIIKESIRSILNEGTDVLYHFTDLSGLMGIVENDRFELTNNRMATEGGNVMSFSRTKSGGYGEIFAEGPYDYALVRLTIDGRKLNQRYKTYPIDDLYMYPEEVLNLDQDEKAKYKFGQFHWPKEKPGQKNDTEFEYEDRLVTNADTIPNASSYITRIDMYFSYFCDDDDAMARFLDKLLRTYHGRIHIYGDLKSYLLQNPRGEEPITEFYMDNWVALRKLNVSTMPDGQLIKKCIKAGIERAREYM